MTELLLRIFVIKFYIRFLANQLKSADISFDAAAALPSSKSWVPWCLTCRHLNATAPEPRVQIESTALYQQVSVSYRFISIDVIRRGGQTYDVIRRPRYVYGRIRRLGFSYRRVAVVVVR